MKKIFFLAVLLFLTIFSFAQEPISLAYNKEQNMNFFKSYEDFIAQKPVEGIKLERMSEYGWNVEVNQNGKVEKIKDSKIPYAWFCKGYNLMRVYEKEIYYVIDIGQLCFYVRCRESSIKMYDDGTYYMSPSEGEVFKEYYSEGINGEIKVLKDKVFEDYLEKYGLKEAFDKEKKPKREMKDSVLGYKNKEWNVVIKYKKLLIQKMK